MQSITLSSTDLTILKALQSDGRMSYTKLAKKVGLSNTPCIERVKRLEKDGLISGYAATLNPNALGAGLVVFVQIRLNRTAEDVFEAFAQKVMDLDDIQECYLVSGNFDYLLKARVADMDEYRYLLGQTLLSLPGVQESTSYVVMEEIKDSHAVNIDRAKRRLLK